MPREAIDNEIDNTESSSIIWNFFYDRRNKSKDSKEINILENKISFFFKDIKISEQLCEISNQFSLLLEA